MTEDEIRAVTFHPARRGYKPQEVDAFIEQVALAVARGEPVGPLLEAAAFREVKRDGYSSAEVDAFIERVGRESLT
jgi:DivIVA domain-containing protein